MKNIRLIAGAAVIVLVVVLFAVWEGWGREQAFSTEVIAASADISRGAVLSEENICIKSVEDSDLIDGVIGAESFDSLLGRRADQYIPKGAQLNDKFLTGELVSIGSDQSIYCLSEDMLTMVSSSLRRGDMVTIYGNDGKVDLGSFQVAFVKDSADREVKNADELLTDLPYEREDSNYSVSSIEIVCTRDDYARITDYTEESGQGLTVVQEIDPTDSTVSAGGAAAVSGVPAGGESSTAPVGGDLGE